MLKGNIDRRDIQLLLLRYPQLKTVCGAVEQSLMRNQARAAVFAEWARWVASTIEAEQDDGY
jgi:hypothetical protein